MAFRRRTACALTLATLLGAGSAAAEPPARLAPSAADKETARSLMQEGDAKLAAGELRAALEAYTAADAIMNVPTTALAVGRASAKLGLLVEAVDALQRARRHPEEPGEPEAFRRARREAAELDAELARRIPTIEVRAPGPSSDELTVRLDGEALTGPAARQPRRVNPGPHIVEVVAPGYRTAQARVTIDEGAHEVLTLRLEPAGEVPQPPPAPRAEAAAADASEPEPLPLASWIGFGVGAAGLVVGTTTGVVVLRKTGALEDRCGGTRCAPSEQPEHERIVTLANVSNVALALGAVGAAVGAGALVYRAVAGDGSDAAVGLRIGPGGLAIEGTF